MKKILIRLGLAVVVLCAGIGGYFALDSYGYIDPLLYGFGWDKVQVYEESHRIIKKQSGNIIEVEERHVYRRDNQKRTEELKVICDISENKCAIFVKKDGEWKHLMNVKMKPKRVTI